jgi:hypothetical protein
MKTSGGKKKNFFPELLAEIETEFGVRMAAVCSAGAGLEAGRGSAASFTELLSCVPRSCRFVVPVICGNDWYDGFVRPLRASTLDAARSFCAKLIERQVCSLSVLGMSSAVWGYDAWMAPLSARRFDEHAVTMAGLFESFGLKVCNGAAELAVLKLADRIGHVHCDSKDVLFGAVKAWLSKCMLLLAGPPAPGIGDGWGPDVGVAPAPPIVPNGWEAVCCPDGDGFYFWHEELGRSQWDVPIESVDGWVHVRDGDGFAWMRTRCGAKLLCPPPVVAYPWEAVFDEGVGDFFFRRVDFQDHWCEKQPPRTPSGWVSAWSEEWRCFFYEHVGTGRSFWELEVPLLQWHGWLPVGTVLDLRDVHKAFRRFCLKCHPDKAPGDDSAKVFFTEMREVFGTVEAALRSLEASAGSTFEPVWDFAEACFGLRRISTGDVVHHVR